MSEESEYGGVLVLDEDAFFLQQLADMIVPARKIVLVKPQKPVGVIERKEVALTAATKPEPKGEEEKEKEKPLATRTEKKEVVHRTTPSKERRSESGKKEESNEQEETSSKTERLVKGQWKQSHDFEGQYMREMAQYDLLTLEEESELLRRYQATKDKDAWNKLVACNQRLVVKLARQYGRMYHAPFLDMVQEGNFGLMHAIKRFSFEKECRLGTYATWWIRQAITRAIMDKNRTIRLPVHIHNILAKTGKAERRLFKKLGRDPTLEEICLEAGISLKRLQTAEEGLKQVLSMDNAISDSEDSDLLGDFIPDDRPLQDELIHDRELSEHVIAPVIVKLKPQKRCVIVMRFGLVGFPFSEEDIARVMKIEPITVRAMEMAMVQKLDPPQGILFDQKAGMEWLRRVSREALTKQEELLFILRYGIGAQESTLEEVAKYFGVTRERIRQVEAKTLPLIRRYMERGPLHGEREYGMYVRTEPVGSAAKARRGVL